jgi:hypothetical protein
MATQKQWTQLKWCRDLPARWSSNFDFVFYRWACEIMNQRTIFVVSIRCDNEVDCGCSVSFVLWTCEGIRSVFWWRYAFNFWMSICTDISHHGTQIILYKPLKHETFISYVNTPYFTITDISSLTRFKEIIAVYSENYIKPKNKLCGKKFRRDVPLCCKGIRFVYFKVCKGFRFYLNLMSLQCKQRTSCSWDASLGIQTKRHN